MNKKLVSIVMSAATLLSGAAFADFDPQFYVGGEVIGSRLKFDEKKVDEKEDAMPKSLKKAKVGGGAFLGTGVEFGYGILGKRTSSEIDEAEQEATKVSLRSSNVYADVMGYLPLDCATDLIGSVGVGYLHTNMKVTTTDSSDETPVIERTKVRTYAVGPRVGVGAQYKFTDNIGARVMVNYQHAKKDVINHKHLVTAKLGMFYQF
jgi:opacity protein-like surface antigen